MGGTDHDGGSSSNGQGYARHHASPIPYSQSSPDKLRTNARIPTLTTRRGSRAMVGVMRCSPLLRLLALGFVLYTAWSVYFFVAFHRHVGSSDNGSNYGVDFGDTVLASLPAALMESGRRASGRAAGVETAGGTGKKKAAAGTLNSGAIIDRHGGRAGLEEGHAQHVSPDDERVGGTGISSGGGNGAGNNKFIANKAAAERYLAQHGPSQLRQTLSAYVEPPLHDTDPFPLTKANYDQGDKKGPDGKPGLPLKFVEPLPLRTHGPEALKKFEYDRVQTCHDLPAKLPVDAGLLLAKDGNHLLPNVNNRLTIRDAIKRMAGPRADPAYDAKFCPVNADPFLPWIHDLFPSPDGKVIHFVAQNKRRCNTGNRFLEDLHRLEGQVALMQPVSVERVTEGRARELAPELWSPERQQQEDDGKEGRNEGRRDDGPGVHRYRLAPHSESSPDGQFTRFVCRFRYTDASSPDRPPRSVIIGETLSRYPINYELANYRKGMPNYHSMLTPKGKDNNQFWLSNFRFDCPVPDDSAMRDVPGFENSSLSDAIVGGDGVLSDGTPLIHVDLIPLRTSPRFGASEVYFTEDLAGPRSQWGKSLGDRHGWAARAGVREGEFGFDAARRWGDRNVAPRVEASGRWANLPVCTPPSPTGKERENDAAAAAGEVEKGGPSSSKELAAISGERKEGTTTTEGTKKEKAHTLVACLWASASYTTRGHENAITDSEDRLVEWIEWNLLVGFDHVYVYDNTGAHSDSRTLEPTLFPRFTDGEVTRVEWPFRVCNNNVPAHENTGERSSQYAAESSCRQRYGPHTEWLAAIDPDEYLVPMGKYDSLKDVVRDAARKGTSILGFKSTRAVPLFDTMLPYHDYKDDDPEKDCGTEAEPKCLQKSPDRTFLETYNCDMEKTPKPDWAQRAKKQIYRPDYVLSHYVHYSTITQGLVRACDDGSGGDGGSCPQYYREHSPNERFTDEVNEAVMIHSKTLVPRDSVNWRERCRPDFVEKHSVKCRVGFPVPDGDGRKMGKPNGDGMKYNCYTNEKVSKVWLPRLKDAMEKRRRKVAEAAAKSLTKLK